MEVDDTYFHPAASLYIHGDSVAASNLVEKGLSQYPDDAKLKRLKDLLKQEQQQNENQQDQDQQDQDQQEQDQQEQQQQDRNQQDQQSQDGQNSEQEERQDQDQPQNQDQQQEQAGQEPRPAEEMTPEEARQLLDAMKQEEKNERMQLRPIMGQPIHVEKDW